MNLTSCRGFLLFFLGALLIGNLLQSFWLTSQYPKSVALTSISEIHAATRELPSNQATNLVEYTIKKDDNIYSILSRYHVTSQTIHDFLKQTKKVFHLANIKENHALVFKIYKREIAYLKYYITADQYLEVTPDGKKL